MNLNRVYFMSKNDVSARVQEMIKDFLDEKDLSIYKIDYKKAGKVWNLDVYIDKASDFADEFITIEECEMVNRYLSDKLDKADIIPHQYTLSVNSPGLDRELISENDFKRFKGRVVEVNLYEQIDNIKHFEGILQGLIDDVVLITVSRKNKEELIEIPRDKIAKINLSVIF